MHCPLYCSFEWLIALTTRRKDENSTHTEIHIKVSPQKTGRNFIFWAKIAQTFFDISRTAVCFVVRLIILSLYAEGSKRREVDFDLQWEWQVQGFPLHWHFTGKDWGLVQSDMLLEQACEFPSNLVCIFSLFLVLEKTVPGIASEMCLNVITYI